MRAFIDDIARSIAFVSRLPVPARHFHGDDHSLSRTVRAFPIAGAIIALPVALIAAALAIIVAPPFLAASLIVGLQLMITGALHEDGLADTADGLGAGRDRERALAIMKDSRTGVFGVVALVNTLLVRVAALATLVVILPPEALALALIAIATASRAAMVWHWHMLPPARSDGLAVSMGRPAPKSARLALFLGALVALPLLPIAAGPIAALVAVACALAAFFVFTGSTRTRLGGATGDTIGATQQLVEVALLAGLALCL
jgi:adenosylcobinamide-GDP ribazoletransferase